jgi:hypothetical protein
MACEWAQDLRAIALRKEVALLLLSLPKPVLRVRLQTDWHSVSGRRAVPDRRLAALAEVASAAMSLSSV